MTDFLSLAKDAYEASSAFVDTNYRADWDYSLRAFRNEHSKDSKYSSPEYAARSRIFPPHTRTIIRKNEAAGMQAMFSNREVVNVQPENPDDLMSVAAAACIKEVLEYRMSRTIPAFETYLGGLQDAQTQGAVVSYQYWEYQKKGDRIVKDQPCIELRPIENIRLDGGASWIDPVCTSPYMCDIIPMYVCDVKAMMKQKDEKTGAPKWKTFPEDVIIKATPDAIDSTRQARLGKGQDPQRDKTGIKAYDIVWVMRWFVKDGMGDDYCFYTLGTEELLTTAKPIEEVYFHGKRPYVMGFAILETHKVFKSSMPVLLKPLQQESADIRNQRLDNVKFVLNKRWIVARGRQVDVQSLVRNVPGGVTLVTDPKTDVQESNWPDVTSSSFVEEDRLKSNLDELGGNFSPSTKVANNAVNDTLGGSKMAAHGAGLMTEYLLRTVNETWWEKVMRQLVLLEQNYETNAIVLAVCAKKARLFPRFGMSQITDDLLLKEVIVTVDASMGDPQQRFNKFMQATMAANQTVLQSPPGANVKEMVKEIYSNAGYRDGARFWNEQEDPRLVKAMQMIRQMQGMIKSKQMELQAQGQIEQLKLQSNEKIKGAEIQVNARRIEGDLQVRAAELEVQRQELALEQLKVQLEARGKMLDESGRLAEFQADAEQAGMKLEVERTKLLALREKTQAELEKSAIELQTVRESNQNEAKIGDVAAQVTKDVQQIGGEIARMKEALSTAQTTLQGMDALKTQMGQMGQGLSLVMQAMNDGGKKKATGFRLKKKGGKTASVSVRYADGTEEDMPVTQG